MQRQCNQCSTSFEIEQSDLDFYNKVAPEFGGEKIPIPPPTLCPACRLQRRMSFYNCRSLYKRNCDFTKKPIVSIFSPDKPYTVYNKKDWFRDVWDPMEFGIDVDFQQPFLKQVRALALRTPMLGIMHFGDDNLNSDFTNDNYKVKNCYLVFDGEQAQDCMYGQSYVYARNCMDFLFIHQCELCYECCYCDDSYGLRHCRYCKNCSDSWFLRDCIGCRNCFGCANLRQKQYCVWNEQKTKDEYERFLNDVRSSSHENVLTMRSKAEAFFITQPVRATRGEQNVNTQGDNVNGCKNAYWCFDGFEQQDCRYCTGCMMPARDNMDIHVWGDGLELSYDSCVTGANCRNIFFCYNVSQGCSDIFYSLYCSQSCSHLFGCVGLRHKSYCILNKQYTKEQYEVLVPRIIDHMRNDGGGAMNPSTGRASGSWGEFFPSSLSLFGYNETVAQTYFPMTKQEAREHGYQWCDYEAEVQATRTIPAEKLPDDSTAVPDDILNWALICEISKKPFKIVKQELDFYRTYMLPIPRRHPDQRHRGRFTLKNPFKLWKRTCANCSKEIDTAVSPERPEIVWCNDCYLKELY